MIPRRIIMSVMDYDPEIHAKVVPWAHRLHAWVGLVFLFDDDDRDDQLVYMTSNWDGEMEIHVHQCKATALLNDDGSINVSLGTEPDPDKDRCLRKFKMA